MIKIYKKTPINILDVRKIIRFIIYSGDLRNIVMIPYFSGIFSIIKSNTLTEIEYSIVDRQDENSEYLNIKFYFKNKKFYSTEKNYSIILTSLNYGTIYGHFGNGFDAYGYHRLSGPAKYSDSGDKLYFIKGKELEYKQWLNHPLVKAYKMFEGTELENNIIK